MLIWSPLSLSLAVQLFVSLLPCARAVAISHEPVCVNAETPVVKNSHTTPGVASSFLSRVMATVL